MPILRAQVALDPDSGIPADFITNTWHFSVPDSVDLATDGGNIVAALQAFYEQDTPPSGNTVSSFFSSAYNTQAAVAIYSLDSPEPRAPVYEDVILFEGGDNPPLPEEVALCMSYNAAQPSGSNRARRRGRIYLGPFHAGAVATDANGHARPAATLIQAISEGLAPMIVALTGSDVTWVVYSPTDDVGREVVNVHVDDAWDTQRRRGVRASGRTITPIVQAP